MEIVKYGGTIDLSTERHTACPVGLHGNTKIPDYSDNHNVVKVYRERKGNDKNHFLWKIDVVCSDCKNIFSVWEYKFKRRKETKCSSCLRSKNLCGKRFGKLIVLNENYYENGNRFWECVS